MPLGLPMTMKSRPLHVPHPPGTRTLPISSTVTPSEKARTLKGVTTAAAAFEAARASLHQAVQRALEHGASWSEIGGVLGVSRQAAFQRFGPKQALRSEPGVSDS